MAELGLPGVKKGKTWVGRHIRDTRNALVVLWRWFGAPSATLVGGGGSVAAGNAGELALAVLRLGSGSVGSACVRRASAGHGRARWG